MQTITHTCLRQAMRRPCVVPIRMLATMTRYLDIGQEIQVDHDNIRDLFRRYQQTGVLEDKRILANTLVRELSIHGDVEELTVYKHFPEYGLKEGMDSNKDDHAKIRDLILQAERSHTAYEENFDQILSEAVYAFIWHASEEETVQLPKLTEMLTAEQNDQIARAFLKARNSVPVRPTARPSGVLNGRNHDKMIDVLKGREFAELNLRHNDA